MYLFFPAVMCAQNEEIERGFNIQIFNYGVSEDYIESFIGVEGGLSLRSPRNRESEVNIRALFQYANEKVLDVGTLWEVKGEFYLGGVKCLYIKKFFDNRFFSFRFFLGMAVELGFEHLLNVYNDSDFLFVYAGELETGLGINIYVTQTLEISFSLLPAYSFIAHPEGSFQKAYHLSFIGMRTVFGVQKWFRKRD